MGTPQATHPSRRRWDLLPPVPPELPPLLGMPPLWAQLLYNRDINDPDQAREFLDANLTALHDPFLFAEMDRAIPRILAAIQADETVAVYGDFDTDGVTATVLLRDALVALGAKVITHIPHRVREGHGLNREALTNLRSKGASLTITVDTGITATEEVETARSWGMDIIITDHHIPPDTTPSAYAVITPHHTQRTYPFPHLTGAGLALKLAQALYQTCGKPLDDGSLELAALGTVADMAPLRGENRVLARAGLDSLRRTRRPGLLALLESAGLSVESLDHETIPYTLAPRLNASGRMDTADLSFRLLTCQDMEEARALAGSVGEQNIQRRQITEALVARAFPEAESQARDEFLLMLEGEEYVPGVNGLVATKMVEALYRPTVVVSLDGDLARGSGRSIPEFNLAKAFSQCADLFLRSGGHPAAAGFTAWVKDLPELRQRLQASARSTLGGSGASLSPSIRIDAEVTPKELLGETFAFLRALAPFGQGNPPPTFLTRGMRVTEARAVGAQGQHLRLTLKQGGALWDAIAFGRGGAESGADDGVRLTRVKDSDLDVVYTIGVDTFRGRGTAQLQVLDFQPSA